MQNKTEGNCSLNKKRKYTETFLEQNKENFFFEIFDTNSKKFPEKINEILTKNKINPEFGFFLMEKNQALFLINFHKTNQYKFTMENFFSNNKNTYIQSFFLKRFLKKISNKNPSIILIIKKNFCKKNDEFEKILTNTNLFKETNSNFIFEKSLSQKNSNESKTY